LEDAAAALRQLDQDSTVEIAPSQRPLYEMVRLAAAGDADPTSWSAVLASSVRDSLLDERLEILLEAARAALRAGTPDAARRYAHSGLKEAGGAAAWTDRFDRVVRSGGLDPSGSR